MTRANALKFHIYPVRTEMTATKQIPVLRVCSTDESELEEFLIDKNLSHIYSKDKDKSKGIVVDERSTEEDESEYVHKNISKKEDANNEAEYEESSVTHEVPRYFNKFEFGRNLLNRLDVTYERACMATPRDKYYTKMLETIVVYNYHHNAPLSNEIIRQ